MPDVSEAKAWALCRVGGVDVLVSYSTLTWKPVALGRLSALRAGGCVAMVMLDSGAYHHGRGALRVEVEGYAGLAEAYGWLFDLVVAADVPGDPGATLERSLRFAELYSGPFIPVAQPPPGEPSPEAHAGSLEELEASGLLSRAPRPRGRPLAGIGGLDGPRRRARYLAALVSRIAESWSLDLHLFGVGARLLASLARRRLLHHVYSVDTGAWQAEIRWRRRTVYKADGPLEANEAAIRGYLERVAAALASTA
jgi:hypothetical protein